MMIKIRRNQTGMKYKDGYYNKRLYIETDQYQVSVNYTYIHKRLFMKTANDNVTRTPCIEVYITTRATNNLFLKVFENTDMTMTEAFSKTKHIFRLEEL